MVENDIPPNANASVSMLYIDTNFTYFCTDEVKNRGGLLLYKDWYNFIINEQSRYSDSDNWIPNMINPDFYNIFQGSGDVKICSIERLDHQIINVMYFYQSLISVPHDFFGIWESFKHSFGFNQDIALRTFHYDSKNKYGYRVYVQKPVSYNIFDNKY